MPRTEPGSTVSSADSLLLSLRTLSQDTLGIRTRLGTLALAAALRVGHSNNHVLNTPQRLSLRSDRIGSAEHHPHLRAARKVHSKVRRTRRRQIPPPKPAEVEPVDALEISLQRVRARPQQVGEG